MPDHKLPTDRPDERARRERPAEEAVEEMEAVLDDQTTPTHDMPPLREKYGGVPDESKDS